MKIAPHDIIAAILLEEGSAFTDRPADRGGPTKYGVTLATLAAYRAPRPTTVADLKALDAMSATTIYVRRYLEEPGFGGIIDSALAGLVVDAGVQHGVPEATKMLQRAVALPPDGKLGPQSLSAINSHDAGQLRALVCGARIRLYGSIIARDPQLIKARLDGYALQAENAAGWANRIARFVENVS